MRKLFLSLLIFVFVMCFFFIPHGDAVQVPKLGLSITEILQDGLTLNDPCIVSTQILLARTHGTLTVLAMKEDSSLMLVLATVYEAACPRSFHMGK